MNKTQKIKIIGGGLAGCEAAWQLANRNFDVEIFEMRPEKLTPAHKTGFLAEIVCSNSFGSENNLENERITAAGILKEELKILNSLVLECSERTRIPAGGALAVDRDKFSSLITEKIYNHEKISVIKKEITNIPKGPAIIATGPLTSDSLAEDIKNLSGKYISFYDAVAPVITKDSIDMNKVFVAGRYGRGDDYINCPFNKTEYENFYNEIIKAERNLPHDFERNKYFEGCMPIEAIAERGIDTLRFGPMKPKGLRDPKTGHEPWAVVQLRQDNSEGNLYNLVGFQTGLKWGEQKRVFSMIPGLENAEFVRLGVMHRNTSVNAPLVLDKFLRFKNHEKENIFFAGQITGVEGYIESTATGLVVAINLANIIDSNSESEIPNFPRESAIGSLLNYLQTANPEHFQPMNINLGLFPSVQNVKNKIERSKIYRERAINSIKNFKKNFIS